MKILYEDKSIVVCIKERGFLSQWSENKPNMVDALKEITGTEIYPVHRLDKDVGGVMVYAKTDKAASELSRQIAERTFEKEYIALVHSVPQEKNGTMEDLLFFDKSKNKSFVVKKERRGVKKAVLEYEVLEERGENTLVRVKLLTGRTHQIRVQFASRKMPLVGDRRYGSRDEEKIIALWSYRLYFFHPETKKKMSFELLPEDERAIF